MAARGSSSKWAAVAACVAAVELQTGLAHPLLELALLLELPQLQNHSP
jgi:hypothetical protein